jgi:hypothetical protein
LRTFAVLVFFFGVTKSNQPLRRSNGLNNAEALEPRLLAAWSWSISGAADSTIDPVGTFADASNLNFVGQSAASGSFGSSATAGPWQGSVVATAGITNPGGAAGATVSADASAVDGNRSIVVHAEQLSGNTQGAGGANGSISTNVSTTSMNCLGGMVGTATNDANQFNNMVQSSLTTTGGQSSTGAIIDRTANADFESSAAASDATSVGVDFANLVKSSTPFTFADIEVLAGAAQSAFSTSSSVYGENLIPRKIARIGIVSANFDFGTADASALALPINPNDPTLASISTAVARYSAQGGDGSQSGTQVYDTADSTSNTISLFEGVDAAIGGKAQLGFVSGARFADAANALSSQQTDGSTDVVPGLNGSAASGITASSGGAPAAADIAIDGVATQSQAGGDASSVNAEINDVLNDAGGTRSSGTMKIKAGGPNDDGESHGSANAFNETDAISLSLGAGTTELAQNESTISALRTGFLTSTQSVIANSGNVGQLGVNANSTTSTSILTTAEVAGGGQATVAHVASAQGITGTANVATDSTTTVGESPVVPVGGGLDLTVSSLNLSVQGTVNDYTSVQVVFTYISANPANLPQIIAVATATLTVANGGATLTTGGAWNNAAFALDANAGTATLTSNTQHVNNVVAAGDVIVVSIKAHAEVTGDNNVSAHGEIYVAA